MKCQSELITILLRRYTAAYRLALIQQLRPEINRVLSCCRGRVRRSLGTRRLGLGGGRFRRRRRRSYIEGRANRADSVAQIAVNEVRHNEILLRPLGPLRALLHKVPLRGEHTSRFLRYKRSISLAISRRQSL